MVKEIVFILLQSFFIYEISNKSTFESITNIYNQFADKHP